MTGSVAYRCAVMGLGELLPASTALADLGHYCESMGPDEKRKVMACLVALSESLIEVRKRLVQVIGLLAPPEDY